MYEKFGILSSGLDFSPLPKLDPPRHQLKLAQENLLKRWTDSLGDPKRSWRQNSFRSGLEKYLREKLDGNIEVHLFGSSINGFALPDSDLDVCIVLKGYETMPLYLDFRVALLEIAAALVDHPDYEEVEAIPDAKVPIVRFHHKRIDLKGDISLYNCLGLANSKLLNAYHRIDPRVRALVVLVKYWAGICEMRDGRSGLLSSYAWTIMVIHYLQQCRPRVLPVLQKIQKPKTKHPSYCKKVDETKIDEDIEARIDGWEVYFFEDVDNLIKYWHYLGENKQSIRELWIGFLRYYTEDFDFESYMVQIRDISFRKLNGGFIHIQDPFELSHNLAHSISIDVFHHLFTSMQKAIMLFDSDLVFEKIRCHLKGDFGDLEKLTNYYRCNLPLMQSISRHLKCRCCLRMGHFSSQCPENAQLRSKWTREETNPIPKHCSLKNFTKFMAVGNRASGELPFGKSMHELWSASAKKSSRNQKVDDCASCGKPGHSAETCLELYVIKCESSKDAAPTTSAILASASAMNKCARTANSIARPEKRSHPESPGDPGSTNPPKGEKWKPGNEFRMASTSSKILPCANLIDSLTLKIEAATALRDECTELKNSLRISSSSGQSQRNQKKIVPGLETLERKLDTELAFFRQLEENPGSLKESHLTCSNLNHFQGLVDAVKTYPDVVAVLKSFRLAGQAQGNKLVVAVVCSGGSDWVKVVARNPRGLLRAFIAGDSKRERNLVVQAQEYLETAAAHPHLYRSPRIIFHFTVGVPDKLAKSLGKLGVETRGKVVGSEELPNWIVEDDSDDDEESEGSGESSDYETDDEESEENMSPSTSKCHSFPPPTGSSQDSADVPINLDITAFFAFVSSLTNGGARFKFTESLLDEQSAWERERPVLPLVNKLVNGRKLICCQTAYASFREIVEVVGGPEEKKRAAEFLKRVTVLPDRTSDKASALIVGGKVKERSKVIFGSGDYYQAVTLTANLGFVHAAAHQGVDFAVFVHESRALSEQKQSHAIPL